MSIAKVVVGCLVAGALAAPPVTADEATTNCVLDSLRVGNAAGTFDGVVHGYVVHAGDADATIRCHVEVDGVEVSSTPTGTGVTAGHVSFTVTRTSVVRMCAQYDDAHGSHVWCEVSFGGPLGAWDEMWDVLNSVFYPVDPLVCVVLASLAGTYGNVEIGPDGDVYVDGRPKWDCPPYQHLPPG